jgi:hypothetical protein
MHIEICMIVSATATRLALCGDQANGANTFGVLTDHRRAPDHQHNTSAPIPPASNPALESHPPRIALVFLPAIYLASYATCQSSHQSLTSDTNQSPEALLDYAVCALLNDRRKVRCLITTLIRGTRWIQYVRIMRRPGGPSRYAVAPLRHAQAWRWVPVRKTSS